MILISLLLLVSNSLFSKDLIITCLVVKQNKDNQDPSPLKGSDDLDDLKKHVKDEISKSYLLGRSLLVMEGLAIAWVWFHFHSVKTLGLLDGVDGKYESLLSLLEKKKKLEYQTQSKNPVIKVKLRLLRHIDPKSFYALLFPFSDYNYEPFLNWIVQAALQDRRSWQKLCESILINNSRITFKEALAEKLSDGEKSLLNEIFGTYEDEKAFEAITKIIEATITPRLRHASGIPYTLKSSYLPLAEKRIPLVVSIVQKLIRSKHATYVLSQEPLVQDLHQECYLENLSKNIDFFQEFIETVFKPALLDVLLYHYSGPSAHFTKFRLSF